MAKRRPTKLEKELGKTVQELTRRNCGLQDALRRAVGVAEAMREQLTSELEYAQHCARDNARQLNIFRDEFARKAKAIATAFALIHEGNEVEDVGHMGDASDRVGPNRKATNKYSEYGYPKKEDAPIVAWEKLRDAIRKGEPCA